jgi:glutaminyl-tRNA synthetase
LAEADLEMKTKPKAFMNWISAKDSIACEVRLYDVLFNDNNPAALGDKWLDFYNKESLVVKNNSLMNVNLLGSPKLTTFQFER